MDARGHAGDAVEPKSTLDLILLTLAIGGLQIAWSVELATISPFLLSLGLSKSSLALVWIAAPLAGTVVQPYVGFQSDRYRSSWGRRKPFMIYGAIATMISLLALSRVKKLLVAFMTFLGAEIDGDYSAGGVQLLAIILVYVLDFAINVTQAATRAFIVDCTPAHQQQDVNAWAGTVAALGNTVGYLSGYIYWPGAVAWLGNTQFKALVAIACFFMSTSLAVSCLAARESAPVSPERLSQVIDPGFPESFKAIVRSMGQLPQRIRHVCLVQVFAWLGWFPFLFYTTTFIGNIYAEPYFKTRPNMDEEGVNAIWERGARLGSFSLLTFAVTNLFSSVLLPLVIAPMHKHGGREVSSIPLIPSTQSQFSVSQHDLQSNHRASPADLDSQEARPPEPRTFKLVHIPRITLRRAWFFSHLCFAALMWLTLFVHSTTSATVLVALVGIPWAITNWAPFALIAAQLSYQDSQSTEERIDEAGVVLGIHNVAIAAPQIVTTLISSAVFEVLQKPRGEPGDDSVGWVLRFGGLCALVAAWVCWKGDEEAEHS